MNNPPAHPDPEVARVEAAIRALTEEQWEAVRERLRLCSRGVHIDSEGGWWCCDDSRPGR